MVNIYRENTLVWVYAGLLLSPLIIFLNFLDFNGGWALLFGLCIGTVFVISLSAIEKMSAIGRQRLNIIVDTMLDKANHGEKFIIRFEHGGEMAWLPEKEKRR